MNRLRVFGARALSVAGICGLVLVGLTSPAVAAGTALSASGNGTQEVPPGSASNTVAGTFDIDAAAGTITYMVSFTGTETVGASHIHKGAAGVAGDVVVTFDAAVVNAKGTATMPIDKTLAAAIIADPAGYYLNAHTKSNPGGAARGQLTASKGTAPTAVNAGTGGQFAAAHDGWSAAALALLIGGGLIIVGGAGAFLVRRRNI